MNKVQCVALDYVNPEHFNHNYKGHPFIFQLTDLTLKCYCLGNHFTVNATRGRTCVLQNNVKQRPGVNGCFIFLVLGHSVHGV